MKKQGINYVACILMVSAIFSIRCDDDEGSQDKLTLSEAVPGTVTVSIDDDAGTIQFDLTDVEFDDAQYDAFVEMVGNGTIRMAVVDDETSVSFNLTSGTMVDQIPSSPGEYQIEMNEKTLAISFFNEFESAHLDVGGDYSALIEVMNNDEFTTESFVADVEVE
jgi:hypothetical protein